MSSLPRSFGWAGPQAQATSPLSHPSRHGENASDDTSIDSHSVTPSRERGDVVISVPQQPPSPGLGRAFIIGVAGGTASGKTSLCKMLERHHTHVAIVSQDSFYKTLTPQEKTNVASKNFDEPAAFDWELMRDCLAKLRDKNVLTEVPIYDYVTHSRRTDTAQRLFGHDVVLFEGILAFHTEGTINIKDLMDLKIFVETDSDTALARRVVRDIRERGRTLESVLYQYQRFVKPEYVAPLRRVADLIIPWGDYGNNMSAVDNGDWQNTRYPALDMIVQHIRTKLSMPAAKPRTINLSSDAVPSLKLEEEKGQ